MMIVDFIKKSKFLFLYFLILILVSCDTHKKPSQRLLGEWSATWSMQPEAFPDVHDQTFVMNGKVDFLEEGSVKILAFGYPGCIFSSDTLLNQLQWRLQNDTINLINDADQFNLSYRIMEMSETLVQLELMEDIHLTLTRNL
jgi:hypothetical protein